VRPRFPRTQRLLLFRTYLFLVAGLLLVATVLDFGFGYLQSSETSTDQRWLATTFDLIERELAGATVEQRDIVAAELSADIGIDISLLQTDDVVIKASGEQDMPTLVDAHGNTSYLRQASALNAIIRLGPVVEPKESLLLRTLPPLFYLSIFVVVGIWLRPLLRDINLITHGAQRFAADYREPLATADSTTELTGLARNLDDMSTRLSGLIQSQKELIAALSHEMRTPLARIRFALAIIGNKGGTELKEPLDDVDRDVQEIDDLIASMLNYARLDHPDLRMNWQQVPVSPWLEQTVDKCRQADIDITLATDEAPDSMWMDARLMALALSNLLVNACHYAKHRVRCSVRKEKDEYLVHVEDDGNGIPESERESIFKAFTRIDDSRSRDTGGCGLGLAIVARIASLHGGNVAVTQSEELGGARFTLRWQQPDPESLQDLSR
jgi:signal transduction histidine kinase